MEYSQQLIQRRTSENNLYRQWLKQTSTVSVSKRPFFMIKMEKQYIMHLLISLSLCLLHIYHILFNCPWPCVLVEQYFINEELYQTLFRLQEIRLLYNMIGQPASAEGFSLPTPQSSSSFPHLFSLKKNIIFDAPTVKVDFAPIVCQQQENNVEIITGQVFKAYPIFNDDGCYFTPSFMLHHDKVRTPQNLTAFYGLHQTRVEQITEERWEMLVPRPTKTNSFCCICKTYFEDYLQHVTRNDHMELIQRNLFSRDIQALCRKFGKKIAGKDRVKGKPIKKQAKKKGKREVCKEMLRSVSTEVSSLNLGEIRS